MLEDAVSMSFSEGSMSSNNASMSICCRVVLSSMLVVISGVNWDVLSVEVWEDTVVVSAISTSVALS